MRVEDGDVGVVRVRERDPGVLGVGKLVLGECGNRFEESRVSGGPRTDVTISLEGIAFGTEMSFQVVWGGWGCR